MARMIRGVIARLVGWAARDDLAAMEARIRADILEEVDRKQILAIEASAAATVAATRIALRAS